MPRLKKSAPVDPPALIAPLDERIRAGEAQYVAVAQKAVDLGLESYEHLALLVEDGAGREPDVLREALGLGLKAMLAYRRGQVQQAPVEENEIDEHDEVLRPPPLPDGAVVLRPSEKRKTTTLGDVVG